MTELLDQAFARVRALPPETQDEYARVLLRLAGDEVTGADLPIYQLTPEEEADLAEVDDEIAQGAFATDEQVRAVWAKFEIRFGADKADR